MIKYIIKAIKAAQEQHRQQVKLSTLFKIDKNNSIKVRLPKNYIEMLEVISMSGINKPNTLDALIKGEVRFIKHQHYDICEFIAVIDQRVDRYTESRLKEFALNQLVKKLMEDENIIRITNGERTSPAHVQRTYSIKVAIERR
jgi:hypothetical protein